MNKNILNETTREIIKVVQEESTLNGFQYIVSHEELKKKFNIRINREIANEIVRLLEESEEVADVQLDNTGFDVVLYTAYAPNYKQEDYEED